MNADDRLVAWTGTDRDGASSDASDITLEQIGGKGLSLCRIVAAGITVPPAFIVTTAAFRRYRLEHDLDDAIARALAGDDGAPPEARVAALFERYPLGPTLADALSSAVAALGSDAVAVRSSAVAEDSPSHSFAGLHDTMLNVRGEDRLVAAVKRCWASWWTERAMSYRDRMVGDDDQPNMAVVVQAMIDADVSGVLFTANPATGSSSEMLINASFGLGETVVDGSGEVDTFVVDRASVEVVEERIAVKTHAVVATDDSGTRLMSLPAEQQNVASLGRQQLSELVSTGLRLEEIFDEVPQDVEWAIAGDTCYVLQARPITGLPTPPPDRVEWLPPAGMQRLFRRQVVENMPAPLSPLFEDLYVHQGLDRAVAGLMSFLGLPIRLDDFVDLPLFTTVNGYGYIHYDIKPGWQWILKLPVWFAWAFWHMPRLARDLPALWREEGLGRYRATFERWRDRKLDGISRQGLVQAIRDIAFADARYWFFAALMVGFAKLSDGALDQFLRRFARRLNLTSGQFLVGYDSKTLEAQATLEAIAGDMAAIDDVRTEIPNVDAATLASILDRHTELRDRLERYIARYGHQVYNLDFVEPTQGEDRGTILLTLKHLVLRHDRGGSQVARQAMTERRDVLIDETLAAFGPLRRWCFRKLLGIAGKYAPYREQALFYMGAGWPTLRRLAFELGRRLEKEGALSTSADVFFLDSDELRQVAAHPEPKYAKIAAQRRTLRESRKALHPPRRVPEDLRFKVGPFDLTWLLEIVETQKQNADGTRLEGFGVSRGSITGIASVIMTHEDFGAMEPGSILVCPTTTPAWTPLFPLASGLVTDIGAPLAHGSIIAREFGIPAVLGTGNATRIIRSGQRITVDGFNGVVTLEDGGT